MGDYNISKNTSRLPVDIIVKKDSISKGNNIFLCSKSSQFPIFLCSKSSQSPIISLTSVSFPLGIASIKKLGILKEEATVIEQWVRNNMFILQFLRLRYLEPGEFENLMFKAGETPSSNQRDLQQYFARKFAYEY